MVTDNSAMNNMKFKLKRIKLRVYLKLIKLFDSARLNKITPSERYVIMTALCVMKNPTTELLIHPNKAEFYINAKDDNMFICCSFQEYPINIVTLVNHKYLYDIRFSTRAMSIIQKAFEDTVQNRREKLKAQYIQNSEHSLKVIYKNVDDIVINLKNN